MRISRGVIAVALVVLVIGGLIWKEQLSYLCEDVNIALRPSAQLALEYGSRHLDAPHQSLYDIDRSAYFFYKAYALDPKLPRVQHQLARVAFLQGDFDTALVRINAEIALGSPLPSSHYLRGLILGYMGRYDEAADEYAQFLQTNPTNWAGLNDYAWVLLKANRPKEAAAAAQTGLVYFPQNPWLLNTSAIASYEIGALPTAFIHATLAVKYTSAVKERDWLVAYPGNDPKVAREGIETLRRSALENMHMISAAMASSTLQ